MTNEKNELPQIDEARAGRERISVIAREKKQSGELSMIEAGAVMAGAALLALAVYAGGKYVLDLIRSSQFKSEAQMFHTGVLNADQNDAYSSAETLTILAQNHAFDSAGSRVASDKSAVKGMFNGTVTAAAGTLVTSNDSVVSRPTPSPRQSARSASRRDYRLHAGHRQREDLFSTLRPHSPRRRRRRRVHPMVQWRLWRFGPRERKPGPPTWEALSKC